MGKRSTPRRGSMQVWPRKRAARQYPYVRNVPETKEARPLMFAGYKAGMTHVSVIDNFPNSKTKNQEIVYPVSVLECPPLKVFGIRYYKGKRSVGEKKAEKPDKDLGRKIKLAKNQSNKEINDFDNLTLLVHTQPRLAKIKKKPEVFEVKIGGSLEEKQKYSAEKLGKEISINEVFNAGELVDTRAITRGHGYQGPVKRFGVMIRQHKAEKTKRGPGNIGPWTGPKMWRVAHAGQMGYHQRTEYNKWIIRIDNEISKVNPKGAFPHYGIVNNAYLLIKGSVQGAQKRLVMLTKALRPDYKVPKEAPKIVSVNLESKQ